MSPHSPLASIDIGSNSILLLVGRMHQGKLQIQRQRKETIRLGGALDAQGQLEAAAMERGLQCLRRYAELIRDIPSSHRRAVATQTLREASNRDTFCRPPVKFCSAGWNSSPGNRKHAGSTRASPPCCQSSLNSGWSSISAGAPPKSAWAKAIPCTAPHPMRWAASPGRSVFPEWQPGCQRFCTGHTGSPAGAATCAGAAAHACLAAGLWLIRHSRCHQQSPASHG